jgi:hypothetical protein
VLNRGSCIPAGDSAGIFRHCSIPGLPGLLQVHLQHKQFCVSSHNLSLRIANCSLSSSGSDQLYYPFQPIRFCKSILVPSPFSTQAVKYTGEPGPFSSPPLLDPALCPAISQPVSDKSVSYPALAVPFRSSLPSLSVNEVLTGQGLKMPVNSRTEPFCRPFSTVNSLWKDEMICRSDTNSLSLPLCAILARSVL